VGEKGAWFTAPGGGRGGEPGGTGVTCGGGGLCAGGAWSGGCNGWPTTMGAGRVARCVGEGEEGGSGRMGRGWRTWAGGLGLARRNSILCELFNNIQTSLK
jgi:hypothetical protein